MKVKLRHNLKTALSHKTLDIRYRDALSELLSSMALESKLCHGDFHVQNLIKTDDRVYIIDWVDASFGDIRADILPDISVILLHIPEAADMYLRLYCNESAHFKR
jgi:thiamine kinase-like enzyme